MGITREEKFILVDVVNNNNKFWYVELHDTGDVITRWGRVGDSGQSKTFPSAGERFLETKTREKTAKGYQPLRTVDGSKNTNESATSKPVSQSSLVSIAQSQINTNDTLTSQLVAKLAQANVHQILGATTLQYNETSGLFQTPLGVVTQDAINDARRLLTDISDFVVADNYGDARMPRVVSQYLMLIPQNIGRTKVDMRTMYPSLTAIQSQNSLLDSLEASLAQSIVAPKTDTPTPVEKVFDLRIHRVEDGRILDRIKKKYRDTVHGNHACAHLGIKTVFEVENGGMQKAFDSRGRPIGEVWELWHGTKIANLLSIMKTGLRVSPPRSANVTGKMFGNGIYASDQSTKALNYAYGYWDGKRSDNCYMFLLEMAMGKYYTPYSSSESFPKAGYDSTYAIGGRSGVSNNEMIVYKDFQCNLKYLIEFSPQGR